MALIAIIGIDKARSTSYKEALTRSAHHVDIIGSDIEAIQYLVRQKKAPDVLVLDMQWPGSTEMVAIGAMQRLQHLINTKLLIITSYGNKVPRSWSAEVTLYSPVGPQHLADTINDIMDVPKAPVEQITPTRIWWDGQEARFLRWTDQALVLAWADAAETAVKLPRGAAVRLIKKGILRVDGPAPNWAKVSKVALPPQQVDESAAVNATGAPAAVAEAGPATATSPPQINPFAKPAAPASEERDHDAERTAKMNIVARLIRKLTGGSPNAPLRKESNTA